MIRSCLIILIALTSQQFYAQLPLINQPIIASTNQSVFVSPTGNDSNPGTKFLPKKTFSSAISKIDFGIPGINNGQNYGEIVLLQGDYYPVGSNALIQNENQWRKNINGTFVYKNISIRGEGSVIIHGDSLNANTQMIFLQSSKISIKNIKIKNAPLHGIMCIGSAIKHHSDVFIDSVQVHGALDFGILFIGYDRVLVQNSVIANTCLRNENEKNNVCQWASGLRADNCSHVTFRKNEVYHNWGEGINTSLSEYIKVHDNIVYDNYSVNIYAHSASRAIYSHNLIYNIDSTFWRYCYNGKGFSAGLSIANELTCTNACFLWGNQCGSLESCCSETDYDHPILTFVNYKQADSIFVFNNILLGSNIEVWDAFSGFANYANLSNIFIACNTIIDHIGTKETTKSLVGLVLNTNFVNFKNLRLTNNILAISPVVQNSYEMQVSVPYGTCNGNWQKELTISGNLWSKLPTVSGLDFSFDSQNLLLPTKILVDDVSLIIPSKDNPQFIYNTKIPEYITDDFYHFQRSNPSNSGAIEFQKSNLTTENEVDKIDFVISPNPVISEINIKTKTSEPNFVFYNASGSVLLETNQNSIKCDSWPAGFYICLMRDKNGKTSGKAFLKIN